MRISDWSSDVCSSDLVRCSFIKPRENPLALLGRPLPRRAGGQVGHQLASESIQHCPHIGVTLWRPAVQNQCKPIPVSSDDALEGLANRSEEHTSELQSLLRISYAVFCLKKKKTTITKRTNTNYVIKHRQQVIT